VTLFETTLMTRTPPTIITRPMLAGLFLQDNVAQRLAAANQDHAGVDLPLPDAPAVVHDDIAQEFLRLAGAAKALAA
jgi:hypothetical protein